MAENYSVVATLSAKDKNFSSTFAKANQNIGTFGKFASKGLATAAKIGAAAIGAAAGGMVVFAKQSIDAGRAFDSSMSQVAATMGTTVDQIGDLRDFAQEMGRTTAFSATQAADALNYMALAGYDATTSMQMLPNVLNLAAAGGIELAQASDMVTDAQSAFGLTTEQTTQMVDQMAKTSSKTNTSVQQLGEGFLKIGATARNLKGGTQELATMLGVLADNGIKGAEGGTHFRNILLSLQNPTKEGAAALDKLGVSVYDAEGKMRSTVDIFKDMKQGMAGMTDESKQAMLSGMFNKTDLASVNALLNTTDQRFDELTASIGDCEGAAQKMAETQLDNLEGDVTLFKSALEGAQIALSDGLNPALRALTQAGTKGLEFLTGAFQRLNEYVKAAVLGFKSVKGVGTALKDAFSAVAGAIFNTTGKFDGSASSIVKFEMACKSAAEKVKQFAEWVKDHADTIARLVKLVPKLTVAFAGLSVLMKVAPAVKLFATMFTKIGSTVAGGLASKLLKVGSASETVGKKTSVSGKKMLQSAQAFALMGLAVLEIALAFALLAQSAIALANSGGAAIAVFFGMVVAVGALAAVMMVLTKSMASISPAKLTAISTAFLAMGAAVLMISAGFALLAISAIDLANAGGAAIAVFFGMVVAVGALAALMAYLGPMLTAGAVGMLALGAAVLMVGAGIAIACAGIALLATQLPTVATYGLSAAVAFLALGAALLVFGAGALVAGVGLAALTVGLVAFSVGIVAAAAACGVLAVAVGLLGVAFTVAMVAAGASLLIVVASLKLMSSSLSTIASKAKAANASITSMKNGLNVVNQGLTVVGQKAGQIANAIINAFKKTGTSVAQTAAAMVAALAAFAAAARSAGQAAGNGFASGLQSGMNKAVSVTRSALNGIASAMRSGYSSAYSAGAYIGQGLANGMQSQLGRIRSIASQMVNAANQAIVAKAKIGSPSRVTTYDGKMYGQGWINGIKKKTPEAIKAAQGLMFEPNNISVPNYQSGGALNDAYNYNIRETIVVPVEINGREFARVTAPYNQAENNKAQARRNYARGVR